MSMEPLDVITIGSAVRDVVFYSDEFSVVDNPENDPTREQLMCVEYGAKVSSENVHFLYGGGGANTALNFAGMGLRTGVVACVGNDIDGHGIQDHLEKRGVDISLMQTSNNRATGFSFLTVAAQTGERTAYVHYGAAHDISLTKRMLGERQAAWMYVASIHSEKWTDLMKKIQSTGAKIA
jgi:sugar/nucleoside kinase (ribokinase family)